MAKVVSGRRPRGMIRRRGNSFQVVVYAGIDPLTGNKLHLRESTSNEAEARRILTRLVARVDQQRHAKTNASFRVAMAVPSAPGIKPTTRPVAAWPLVLPMPGR